MSKEIDEKVVEMRFDNKQFEQNVGTTMSTLEKLKKSLQLKDSAKAFEDIDSASKKVDFSGLGQAVESVKVKFSALQVMAITALQNITNSAINAGKNLVKSLSIDQIQAGWDKYADKTSAVQTIMAATSKDFSDTGEQMEYVNGQLEKLNWFTDETSYSFLDMVNNIGKFTSNGVKLDDAVTSMEGISTWAAISGANVTEAGRAMYNLSQAMSVGAVKLMDWKSIENANMATQEFKETVIETAVAEGTLTKAGDGLYRTLAGSEVSVKNFNQSLQDGWFTSEVLTKTLKQYGEFSDKLHELSLLTDTTATELLQSLDEYEAGTLDLKEVAEETKVPVKDLTKYYDELTSETMALGRKSFQAAQEAKTFKEAIDATKDAVSTGWMNTFEKIFGDYEEAKKLWTRVANELWDVFASGGEARNAILDAWRELGGRENLLQGISNTWKAFKNILQSVKDAFREVFFGTSDEDTLIKNLGQSLADASKRFKEFTEKFKMSEETAQKLKTTFKGLFAAIDIVRQIFSMLFNTIKPLFGILPGMGNGILGVTSSFGELLIKIDEFLKTNPTLQSALSGVSKVFEKVAGGIRTGLDKIGSFWEVIKNVFGKIKEYMSSVTSTVGSALKKLTGSLAESFRSNGIGQLLDFANGGVLLAIGLAIKKFFSSITKVTKKAGSFLSGLSDSIISIFDSLKGCLESFQKDIQAKTLIKIATAVALLAGSIWLLSTIDPVHLASALGAITVSFGELLGSLSIFSKIVSKFDKKSTKNMATAIGVMLGLSVSVLILAFALKKIGSMETEDIIEGLVGVGALMAGLVIVCQKLSAIEGEIMKGMGSILIFSFALLILSSAVKSLGKLDPASLAKGLIGVTVLIAEMVAVSKILAGVESAGMISACFSMILMSVALRIAVSSVKALADMKPEQLTTGIIGVSAILMLFAGIADALSQLEEKAAAAIPGAVAMVAMAIALKIAVEPFKELGKMNWDQFAKGAVSMLAIFGIFGGLVALCAAFGAATLAALAGAAAMVAFAVVLKMVVAPFQELGNMSWKQIVNAAASMIAIFEIFGGLVAICAVLGVAVLAAIPGAISMVILAAALKMAVIPFQELGNMSWEQIGKGVVGIIGLLGSLGALGALLGVLSPAILAGSIALVAIGASFKMATAALSAGLDSIAECITKMSVIDPGEFAATIAAISAGIAALGLALIAFNPLSLIGAASMLILSEAILKLAPALLMLKLVGPEDISNEMRVLSIGMAEFGLALKAFGPLAGIGASAMLKLGTAIGIMAPGLAILSMIPGTGVSDTLDTLAEAFVKFGKALEETPFFGAKSRAQGINTLTDGVKKLSESLPTLVNDVDPTKMTTALTNIGDAFFKFGEAISATPFWSAKSRGEGIGIVVDSIKSLSESLPDIVALENVDYKAVLTGIGEGMQSFGTALSETPLFNSKSGGQGIATLVGSLSDLAAGLQALDELQTNSIRIKNRMTAIGEGLQSFSTVIATTPLFNSDKRANGIATMVKSISDLANGMQALNDLQTNNLRIKNRMTTIGEAFQALSSALSGTPLFNSDERATGISTLVSSLQELVPSIKALSELTVDTDRISGIFTALGEGMKAIGESIKKVGKNSEEKSDSISTVITSIKDLSYAIKSISTIKDTDAGTIGTQLGTAISSIKAAAEGFVGLNLDSFSTMVSALNKMIPSLQSLTTINTKTISSNLTAVSTALTSFSSSTSGIAESLVNFSTTGTTAATNFSTGYSDAIESLTSTFTSAGETVISNMKSGMDNKQPAATTAARNIAIMCANGIRQKRTSFYAAGQYVVDGFIQALTEEAALTRAKNAGAALGDASNEGLKEATDENSPSKVFYQDGLYCVLGFVNSFYDSLTSSEIAGKDLAYSAIDGASLAIKRASDILDSDLLLQPTIRPVIDLSDVQNGVGTINGMFGAQRSISVSTSARLSRASAMTMTPEIGGTIAAKSDNADVVSAINILRSDVNALSQKMEGMQVTIDGRKFVGAMTSRIDKSLGKVQLNKKKGV